MIKIFIFISILLNISNALNIELVEHNKATYIKDGRIVFNPIDNVVIKPMDTNIIKPFKNKVLQPYSPALEKQRKIQKLKEAKQKEEVKKQFAKPTDLKVAPVKKENIKVDKESVEFFNTLNNEDNKPVNME